MANLRVPLIMLIDSRLRIGESELIGTAASPAYQWHDSALDTWIWVMDVDLALDATRPDASNVVKAVPIADASHGVHKEGPGTKLRLHRPASQRGYEIVGTASIVNGAVTVREVTYTAPSVSIVYGNINQTGGVTFGSGGSISVGVTTMTMYTWRALTYDELGDSSVNGGYTYGSLPYGVTGKFDANNDLVILQAF